MKRLLFIAILLIAGYQWLQRPGTISYGPGVLVPEAPIQTRMSDRVAFTKNGYDINALARFNISARVLSRENYKFDAGAAISPVDLALGWGNMSDQTVVDQIDISQSGRWYRWRSANVSIPPQEIALSSANMHMIPADEDIALQLSRVRVGEIVAIDGYLVEVEGPGGWRWKSSLTREDTGARACELIWVKRISIIEP